MSGYIWHQTSTSWTLTLVTSNGLPASRALTAREVGRIADAFEVPVDVVLADARLVAEWLANDEALLNRLQTGHHWDTSMSQFYLSWLRGDGGPPPVITR